MEGEEAWPRALEPVLATRTSRPVEVINAGVDGRWMDEYYLELKDRTLVLDPDVVLLGFFIGNDIDGEDARTHAWSAVDARGRPLRIDAPDRCVDRGYRVQCVPQLRWRFPIIRNSHLAQLLFGAGRAIGEWWAPPQDAQEAIFAPQYEAETQRIVERVEDLFVAMNELCRAHGARFLVVMIAARADRSAAGGRAGPRDWKKPQRLFSAFFTARGIPFIDLLPVLRAAQAEGRRTFASTPTGRCAGTSWRRARSRTISNAPTS